MAGVAFVVCCAVTPAAAVVSAATDVAPLVPTCVAAGDSDLAQRVVAPAWLLVMATVLSGRGAAGSGSAVFVRLPQQAIRCNRVVAFCVLCCGSAGRVG